MINNEPNKQPKQLQLGEIKLGPRVQQVFEYIFEHPTATKTQIAAHFEISIARVSQITRSKRFLAAMPAAARSRYRSYIPKALKAQEELIDQKENLMVREKASARVLENENVFEKSAANVQINIFQQASNSELHRMIAQKRPIVDTVIEAELVDPTDESVA